MNPQGLETKKNTKQIFIAITVAVVLLFSLIAWFIISSVVRSPNNSQNKITPTIVRPSPLTFEEMYPEAKATDTTLNLTEQGYPEANKQSFPNVDEKKTGTLIVTSTPEDVRVTIDRTVEESGDGTIVYGNYTPFKWTNIPAGQYHFIATKEDYDMSEGTIEITEGKVTRLDFRLMPL